MRRTLSTIVLALGLVFVAVPIAGATDVDPHAGDPGPTVCLDHHGNPAPCPTPVCLDQHGAVVPCYQPCLTQLRTDSASLSAERATIDRQAQRIARQAKLIKRLRHQLAAR